LPVLSKPTEYYDRYWAEQGREGGTFLLPSLRRLLQENVSADDRCLDVGCGRGQGAGAWLAENAGSYLGVDVSEEALRVARGAGLEVRRIDDAGRLPFGDDEFSLVVCVEVIEHLLDPAAAAAEILRVLRPGGRLIATVPNAAYWRRRFDLAVLGRWNPLGDAESVIRPWRDPHLRFFTRSALGRMLTEAGYDPVRTGGHGGTWMLDVPGFRRLVRNRASGPSAGIAYGRIASVAPTLFAHHLHAVALKPGGPEQPA
jgi:SAM-dependent methyltransferase